MSTTALESPQMMPGRIRRLGGREGYEEPAAGGSSFGSCDSVTCTYFLMSSVLCGLGTTITVLALGNFRREYQYYMGQGWAVGPCLILTGLLFAGKCIMHLRENSVAHMIYHQRQLIRLVRLEIGNEQGPSLASMSGPPLYEVIVQDAGDTPPPSYAEALALLHQCSAANSYQDEKQVESELATPAKP